jgi:hypothetical protein
MYFFGLEEDSTTLMYAAIFSDKSVYECQVSRLLMRLKQISVLYKDKELLTAKKGCETNLGGELTMLGEVNLEVSEGLREINDIAERTNEKNKLRTCALW